MLHRSVKPINVLAYVKTFGLWLITAILAFFEILAVRDIIFNLYARFMAASGAFVRYVNYFTATALGQASVYLMVLVAIVVVIGGFEYHRRHMGQPQSQKVLLWTLGIQLAILLAYLLV